MRVSAAGALSVWNSPDGAPAPAAVVAQETPIERDGGISQHRVAQDGLERRCAARQYFTRGNSDDAQLAWRQSDRSERAFLDRDGAFLRHPTTRSTRGHLRAA